MQSDFNRYLEAEYKTIAEAHFRTNESISSFYRYYLLIMSVPITLVALFIGSQFKGSDILAIVEGFRPLIISILFLVAIVGFLVMCYIANLRMDAILYARTINAMRKRFYDDASIAVDVRLHTSILPQTSSMPKYAEWSYFFPVILSFALFNFFYLLAGIALTYWSAKSLANPLQIVSDIPCGWLVFAVAFLLMHPISYLLLANHREHTYLRSYILGIDIDGVLNKHRDHFCKMLQEKTAIIMNPDNITTIPLHDCELLKVDRPEEIKVFNEVRYWTEMPKDPKASENINRIRNLNLKVHIFSHRPWPNTSGMRPNDRLEIQRSWTGAASSIVEKAYGSALKRFLIRMRLRIGIVEETGKTAPWHQIRRFIGNTPISVITKEWLHTNCIRYDRLTIEQGNENVADPQGNVHNRFYIAKKNTIRYFVEDDLEKAVKLAYICDIVFLMRHPYNTGFLEKCRNCVEDCRKVDLYVPKNVVRVSSWNEIYRCIRALS